MRKRNKGFTLVELLVVIAVLAILATVTVLGYKGFTKNAQESNYISVVNELNTILQGEETIEGKNVTMHDAVLDARENGFDITKMTPTTQGYEIVWSQVDDRFVLMEGEKTIYSENNKQYPVDYRLWKVYNNKNVVPYRTNQKFSIYLGYESGTGIRCYESNGVDINNNVNRFHFTVGLDMGDYYYKETSPFTCYYKGDSYIDGVKPIIRTDNYNNLDIDNANAVVDYYGSATNLSVSNSAMDSVHIYGEVLELTVWAGHAVAQNGSSVTNALIYGGKTDIEKSSTIDNLYVRSSSAQVAINDKEAEPNNITFQQGKGITKSQITLNGAALSEENKLAQEPKELDKTTIGLMTSFSGGTGTQEDPFVITKGIQFIDARNKNAFFKLGNDIEVYQNPTGADLLHIFEITSSGLTLDLNNHNITLETGKHLYQSGKICIFSVTGKLTIKGNGTIDCGDNDATIYCINVNGASAELNIEGGTYIGQSTAVQVQEGTLNIKGGNFKGSKKTENVNYVVNATDGNWAAGTANINITGGNFVFNPGLAVEEATNPTLSRNHYVATNYKVVENQDGTFSVVSNV